MGRFNWSQDRGQLCFWLVAKLSEQVEITIRRLTTRYDERYSNLYIRLEQGENLQMLSDKKISTICIKVHLKFSFRSEIENSVTDISVYKTIQVLRLLNGCKEEVCNRKFQKLGKTSNIYHKFKNSKTESRSWDGAKSGDNLIAWKQSFRLKFRTAFTS